MTQQQLTNSLYYVKSDVTRLIPLVVTRVYERRFTLCKNEFDANTFDTKTTFL